MDHVTFTFSITLTPSELEYCWLAVGETIDNTKSGNGLKLYNKLSKYVDRKDLKFRVTNKNPSMSIKDRE